MVMRSILVLLSIGLGTATADGPKTGTIRAEDGIRSWAAEGGEYIAQPLSLIGGARKPVEDHSILRPQTRDLASHHGEDKIVGHEISPVHERLGVATQLRPLSAILAKQITG